MSLGIQFSWWFLFYGGFYLALSAFRMGSIDDSSIYSDEAETNSNAK